MSESSFRTDHSVDKMSINQVQCSVSIGNGKSEKVNKGLTMATPEGLTMATPAFPSIEKNSQFAKIAR